MKEKRDAFQEELRVSVSRVTRIPVRVARPLRRESKGKSKGRGYRETQHSHVRFNLSPVFNVSI